MRTTVIARELVQHEEFESLGALDVEQLSGELMVSKHITNRELRNALSDIRYLADKIDPVRGGRVVLVTNGYFSMTPEERSEMTEIDARDIVALHGKRAGGILVVNPSIKHHKTIFRAYRKMMQADVKNRAKKEMVKVTENSRLLTPSHRRDALAILGTFNNMKDLRALLPSGK